MRCLAEWTFAAVNKRGAHAVGFCTYAVECVIGNKQDAGAVATNDLLGFRIGFPMRLEITGLLHRNDMIELKADVWSGGLQHVSVAVRQNYQLISRRTELLERGNHFGNWLKFLDLAYHKA